MSNIQRWTKVNVTLSASSREEAIDRAMVEADLEDENITDVVADHLRSLWVVEFTIGAQDCPRCGDPLRNSTTCHRGQRDK